MSLGMMQHTDNNNILRAMPRHCAILRLIKESTQFDAKIVFGLIYWEHKYTNIYRDHLRSTLQKAIQVCRIEEL